MSSFLNSSGERFEIQLDGSLSDESTLNTSNALNSMTLEEQPDEAPGVANNGETEMDTGKAAPSSGPIVVLVIGMAGTGKTTLMHRINLYMNENKLRGYYINLDPAVKKTPFAANIDICDTVNYKEVMAQYGLGPNGGLLTS